MKNEFWAILYVSSAMKDLSLSDVEYFLAQSRKVRMETGISGIAIIAQNNVMVVIEGLKDAVKADYEENKKHPAQHSMIKLFDGPIPYQYFESYPLAFKTIAQSPYAQLDDFIKPEEKEYLDEILELDGSVPRLIKDFLKNNS
jgi:hypothetical protein